MKKSVSVYGFSENSVCGYEYFSSMYILGTAGSKLYRKNANIKTQALYHSHSDFCFKTISTMSINSNCIFKYQSPFAPSLFLCFICFLPCKRQCFGSGLRVPCSKCTNSLVSDMCISVHRNWCIRPHKAFCLDLCFVPTSSQYQIPEKY